MDMFNAPFTSYMDIHANYMTATCIHDTPEYTKQMELDTTKYNSTRDNSVSRPNQTLTMPTLHK